MDRVGTWDISGPTAGSAYCHEYGGPHREGEEAAANLFIGVGNRSTGRYELVYQA
jgi:hypothetical protein